MSNEEKLPVKSDAAKVALDIPALAHFGQIMVKSGSLRMGDLELVCVVKKMEKQHFSTIMGKQMLSPAGADYLNEVAGLEFQEVKEDSLEQYDANGFTLIKKTGLMVGYTMFGKKVVVGPLTLTLSPQAYFMRALGKMATDCTAAPQDKCFCFWGNADSTKPYDSNGWQYYPESLNEGIWADRRVKEVSKALEARSQDRLYGDRRLLGIIRRNLFCMHPGGAPMYFQGSAIPMIAWKPVHEGPQDNRTLANKAINLSHAPSVREALDAEWMPATDEAMIMDGADEAQDETDARREDDNPGGFA